jgi:antitoxin ParD1/3/4
MNVSLIPQLENSSAPTLGRARYSSACEVIREALRLLEEHDSSRAARLAEFNGDLGRRLKSLDESEGVDPAEARARLARKSFGGRKPRG